MDGGAGPYSSWGLHTYLEPSTLYEWRRSEGRGEDWGGLLYSQKLTFLKGNLCKLRGHLWPTSSPTHHPPLWDPRRHYLSEPLVSCSGRVSSCFYWRRRFRVEIKTTNVRDHDLSPGRSFKEKKRISPILVPEILVYQDPITKSR